MPIKIDAFEASPSNQNIFAIGLADNLVTIRSQQLRAICLANLLTKKTAPNRRKNIAIIGGGIAGLTLSAQLLKHGWIDILIFERLPDLLSVQNGCDTRWIHPKIIDWPEVGSNATKADLPILDWKSSTASDVTYQIECEWESLVDRLSLPVGKGKPYRKISVLLGVTFLKVALTSKSGIGRPRIRNSVSVEWIRDTKVEHKKIHGDMQNPSGLKYFSHLVFATGFGIETSAKDSYWRNESLGQLRLDGVQQRFLISGMGDGAIIDLLRVTTKNFRPDRILNELQIDLVEAKLRAEIAGGKFSVVNFFDALCSSKKDPGEAQQMMNLIQYIKQRRRDDSYVVLQTLGARGFRAAFDASPASLLNKLFLFALYKIGAFQFVESNQKGLEEAVALAHNVPCDNIIRRHGVDRIGVVTSLFPASAKMVPIKTGKRGRPKSVKPMPIISLKAQPAELCEKSILVAVLCSQITKFMQMPIKPKLGP